MNTDSSSPYFAKLHTTTRRQFLNQTGRFSLGAVALESLLSGGNAAANSLNVPSPLAPKAPPQPARAKAVIYLSMSGAPPSLDLFDYKPELNRLNMQPCPESFLKGEKFAFIKGTPNLLGSPHAFRQYGQAGIWMSDLLPHTQKIADEICVVNSMSTDQFNHAPAELLAYTGNMRSGAASIGSWVTYGLGSENQDLPGFVALLSGGSDPTGGKGCWGNGFLPGAYQGVQCRSVGDPILFTSNPEGMSRETRRRTLDALYAINQEEARLFGDPETVTRIAQYELAYRMQVSVPEAFDIRKEPEHIQAMYGAEPGKASFANNCLLARRLVEKGVRFVQVFDWGWDMHGTSEGNDLLKGLPNKCKATEQAWSALILDLKQRGMLDDVLVVWGGEFGRTPMNEARGGSPYLGRDHHPHCFTMWLAGGGVKRGFQYGASDEIGYRVAENKVGIRDLQATLLHQLGLDPYHLSYKFQGLNNRLIGPSNEGRILRDILA
ncbi:MAG: hypothetical protein RLZZ399_1293 [Verrucomicrobiota bacterium]|jgi:hypothetical protein